MLNSNAFSKIQTILIISAILIALVGGGAYLYLLREEEERLFYELDVLDGGVLFSYFGTSDIVQHMFWRFLDSEHPLYEDNKSYEGIIQSWYQELDSILGKVMEKIGEEDFGVVEVDDVG